MRQHRITRSAALGLALAALAAPAAMGQQDLRNPDTRDAAVVPAADMLQNLRSPDAVDAADGRGTFSAPDVTVIKVPAPSTPTTSPEPAGLDWTDAGIGAGGVLVLALLSVGGGFALLHRRDGGMTRRATAPTA